MSRIRRHLSFSNVLSCVALFLAISGAAYAAGLGRNSVKARNIAKNAVTTPKLKKGAVTTAKLRNGAVVGSKLANEAVGSAKLGPASVRATALGGGVVTTAKLKNGSVTEPKLANNAVGNAKLGADSVATGKLQDGAVTGAKLSSSLLGQLVKNVTYVAKESATDTQETKTVTAECPSGRQVTGGGARIHFSSSEVGWVSASVPFLGGDGRRTGWTATAMKAATDVGAFSVEAIAICAEF